MKIILRILANALAIYLAARFVPGFVFSGTWLNYLVAGAVLGLINALIRPIITLISLPLIFLTFGLFHIVINIVLLYLASNFIHQMVIQNLWAAIWTIIIISLVNNLFSVLEKD
jgi:putative membrane protein